ncbi:MAG: ribosomal RNA small subunit methyltransferase A [Candidatus Hepatoplasma scabrum]|nr:MAG: ribosomal RNA small subunit methyltransferase A [Candidatus Hepatoplasma sp.]
MVDKNKLNEIYYSLPNLSDHLVIEIGPGTGNLTKKLIINAKKLIAIEIDQDMINLLQNDKSLKNLNLIHADVLKINLDQFILNQKDIYLIANLPYYIATKIIFKFLKYNNITVFAVMLQEELVDRIFANIKTKKYGRLTVAIGSLFSLEKRINVPRECFNPIPNVDSGFIILHRKKIDFNYDNYLLFIKNCFATKRKTLLNSLKITKNPYFEFVKLYLIKNNLKINIRAEQLSIDIYLKIWKEIEKNAKHKHK